MLAMIDGMSAMQRRGQSPYKTDSIQFEIFGADGYRVSFSDISENVVGDDV
jgi:hypothetical protein